MSRPESPLPYLAATCRAERVAAGLKLVHVAVHVVKRDGRAGVSESTVSRFEAARVWPENADRMVQAYAAATGVHPAELWWCGIELWTDARDAYDAAHAEAAR